MSKDADTTGAPAVELAYSLSIASKKGEQAFNLDAVEDVRPRSGTVFTGFAQIFTAVVGSGILALPSAMAALGWIAGTILMVLFAIITYWTTLLLIDCYEYKGVRHATYYDAVKHMLPGTWWPLLMQILQQANLVLTALGYAITAGTALQKVAAVLVPEGTDPNSMLLQTPFWVMVFSCLELLICQIQTLEDLGWVSTIGTIMAFIYSGIAMYYGFSYWGMCIASCLGGKMHTQQAPRLGRLVGPLPRQWPKCGPSSTYVQGTHQPVTHMQTPTQALGTIAFAYSFSFLTIEITVRVTCYCDLGINTRPCRTR